jgi:RimJ/RimL family protein N-acetyltransferase
VSAPAVRLRPALSSDAVTLWRWRNDPQTRAASFSGDAVELAEHERWLHDTLGRTDRRLYVAHAEGRDVATARLDVQGTEAVVSLTVAPEWRGRGIGTHVLRALVAEAFGAAGLGRLVARVKPDNPASRAAFEHAGFVRTAAAGDDGALILVCERPQR